VFYRIIMAMALAAALAAEAPPADPATPAGIAAADLAYEQGNAAYQRALAAEGLGRDSEVPALLREARSKLRAAIAGYTAALDQDPQRREIGARLQAASEVGSSCCGRPSVWERYGIK